MLLYSYAFYMNRSLLHDEVQILVVLERVMQRDQPLVLKQSKVS